MSNTSTVSPYVSTSSDSYSGPGTAEAIIGVGAVGVLAVVALSKWLAAESPEDVVAVQRARADRRRERVTRQNSKKGQPEGDGTRSITSVELHLHEPETLVRTAERLGYQLEPLAAPGEALRNQPQFLLRSKRGERIAIERSPEGRVVVRSVGDRRRIHSLVHEHTADRVAEHFRANGMAVQTARLANGEVQVLAREQQRGQRGGAAEIRAQVRTDGTAWLDIEKVRGTRCEKIVAQVAEAIGGEVCQSGRKDSYFQLPGEPTKTIVKV